MWGTNTLFLREKLYLYLHIFEVLSDCGSMKEVTFLVLVFLPLLCVSAWPIFPLLWSRCLGCSQVLFRGNHSIYSSISLVSVVEVSSQSSYVTILNCLAKFILYVVITMP